jgi:1-deoxy-D-xylulose-5-phosphate synthase
LYERLQKVNDPTDVKALSEQEAEQLAAEIRRFLIDKVSGHGGHLSSNLGDVELTIALHRVFEAPKDKILWDVGHQAYTHKILTGRRNDFDTLRQEGGLSGFPKSSESVYDAFDTGHASTSISAAYGYAVARDQLGEHYDVVAVIGDGSMTGGLAYEAMNNAGKGKSKIIIVLNDNAMAIGHNVGSLSSHLTALRTKQSYLRSKRNLKKMMRRIPPVRPILRLADTCKEQLKYFFLQQGILFEEMGFTYLGPVDGHNIQDLEAVFRQAQKLDESVVIHVRTIKGKGFLPAEKNPELYHGVAPFSVSEGITDEPNRRTWSNLFGQAMCQMAEKDPKMQVITAAMMGGCGLDAFAASYPERLQDVGIAEGHAVTFAAGLAKGGIKPIVAIYSSFLQRAYDQILHDVCIPNLPVMFAIDRAGVCGEDGETHQGVFDIAYLSHIPNFTLMAPSSAEELQRMIRFGYAWNGPIGLRYPRGIAPTERSWNAAEKIDEPIQWGRGRLLRRGSELAVLALGPCVDEALKAADRLQEEGHSVTVADARFASPIDWALVDRLAAEHTMLITVEDHIYTGGFGMQVAAHLMQTRSNVRIATLALPDRFLKQGKREDILRKHHISAEGIIEQWQKRNA